MLGANAVIGGAVDGGGTRLTIIGRGADSVGDGGGDTKLVEDETGLGATLKLGRVRGLEILAVATACESAIRTRRCVR